MPMPRPRDYTSITEVPGSRATRQQLARLHDRYHFAKQLAGNRRVLEVACGAGMGLGYLAGEAQFVVGGDYTEPLLHAAQGNCGGRVPLVRLDAQELPFRESSFDLVFMFEAIYYLQHPEKFVQEARRVLDKDGLLLIGTVNRDWTGFAPSNLSTRYFSVPELCDMIASGGFSNLQVFAAFPDTGGIGHELLSLARRAAARLHLIPGSLKPREALKRILYGRLVPIPPQVTDDMPKSEPPQPIPADRPNHTHSIIYCVARRGGR